LRKAENIVWEIETKLAESWQKPVPKISAAEMSLIIQLFKMIQRHSLMLRKGLNSLLSL
jgi:hypothetical protein